MSPLFKDHVDLASEFPDFGAFTLGFADVSPDFVRYLRSAGACIWLLSAGGGNPARSPQAERLGDACDRLGWLETGGETIRFDG